MLVLVCNDGSGQKIDRLYDLLLHLCATGREESLEIIRNEKRIAYVTNETTYSYDRPKYVT